MTSMTQARKITKDSNGNTLTSSISREGSGWGVTVWFGGYNGLGIDVRRYTYETRAAARRGDISDSIGQNGRLA